MMKQNESSTDRIIRFILGAIILLAAMFWASGGLQILFYIVGLVLIVTAAIGYCALYQILGISTKH